MIDKSKRTKKDKSLDNKHIKVLFCCLGNICRSPTAEGVFRQLVADEDLAHVITTDSSGTQGYHIGREPDSRAQSASLSRGYDISDLRGRKFAAEDFANFDYLIAMDSDNYNDMKKIKPQNATGSLHLFLEFASQHDETEVPDPYYGGPTGFERVLDMVEDASAGLLAHIRKNNF